MFCVDAAGVKIGKIAPFFLGLALCSWTAEHIVMPGIIEFPKVVQDALDQYGDLFRAS